MYTLFVIGLALGKQQQSYGCSPVTVAEKWQCRRWIHSSVAKLTNTAASRGQQAWNLIHRSLCYRYFIKNYFRIMIKTESNYIFTLIWSTFWLFSKWSKMPDLKGKVSALLGHYLVTLSVWSITQFIHFVIKNFTRGFCSSYWNFESFSLASRLQDPNTKSFTLLSGIVSVQSSKVAKTYLNTYCSFMELNSIEPICGHQQFYTANIR